METLSVQQNTSELLGSEVGATTRCCFQEGYSRIWEIFAQPGVQHFLKFSLICVAGTALIEYARDKGFELPSPRIIVSLTQVALFGILRRLLFGGGDEQSVDIEGYLGDPNRRDEGRPRYKATVTRGQLNEARRRQRPGECATDALERKTPGSITGRK